LQSSTNTQASHRTILLALTEVNRYFSAMITVATCNDPMHAQLLKSVLEDSGIPVLIPNELSAQTMPHLILAMGGVRVQVPEEHEETARKLVEDFNTATPGSDTFPPAVT